MAREESDREDLLREATALIERIELAPKDSTDAHHIVVGFRHGGEASVYFGNEPAYHFNTANEFRRAYADGRLYKADRGRLAAMERVRTADAVELQRRDLTPEEQSDFLAEALRRLRELHRQVERGELTIIGQLPAEVNVLDRVRQWLSHRNELTVARSPRVGRS